MFVGDGRSQSTERSARLPLFVPGSRNRESDRSRVDSSQRLTVHVSVALLLIVIIVGTLVAVLPTQEGSANGTGRFFRPSTHVVTPHQDQMALIPAQAATATAVTHDGYEFDGAGGQYSWPGVQKNFVLPNGTTTASIPNAPTSATTATAATGSGFSSPLTGTLSANFYNPFTAGNCTYWADYEYHRLTGNTVSWTGNAATWVSGATSARWNVSSTPHVPSIIVLQPNVQGAGAGSGHVAVVEKLNSDGSVATTNWNVAGWGVFSWRTYQTGPGVSFIWR